MKHKRLEEIRVQKQIMLDTINSQISHHIIVNKHLITVFRQTADGFRFSVHDETKQFATEFLCVNIHITDHSKITYSHECKEISDIKIFKHVHDGFNIAAEAIDFTKNNSECIIKTHNYFKLLDNEITQLASDILVDEINKFKEELTVVNNVYDINDLINGVNDQITTREFMYIDTTEYGLFTFHRLKIVNDRTSSRSIISKYVDYSTDAKGRFREKRRCSQKALTDMFEEGLYEVPEYLTANNFHYLGMWGFHTSDECFDYIKRTK